jgi:hypothetical protein
MKHVRSWILLPMSVLGSIACSDGGAADSQGQDEATPSWEAFQASVAHTARIVDGEERYIVEFDMPVRSRDLRSYYEQRFVNAEKSTVDVLSSTGADNVWSLSAARNLKYCVSTTFGTNYGRIQTEMKQAVAEWMQAANVRFVYKAGEDSNCVDANANVDLPVMPTAEATACAPFPDPNGLGNCTSEGRALVIDIAVTEAILAGIPFTPYHAQPNVTTQDVLTHELGHFLGLRHEHDRLNYAPDDQYCGKTTAPYRALTAYDSLSIMHYAWCGGGAGSGELTLSDKRGIASIYGPPVWQVLDLIWGP